MILQCPGCDTRFLVNPSLIPPQGREVKCAKCAYQWHVDHEEEPAPRKPMAEDRPSDNLMQARVGDDHPEAYHDEDAGFAIDPEREKTSQTVDSLPNMPEFVPESFGDDMPEFSFSGSMPATVEEKSGLQAAPLMALAVVLVLATLGASLFAFRGSLQPVMPWAYDLMGLPRTDGLALSDVVLRQRPLRNKTRYIVEGNIVNESDGVRAIPVLRVAIVDKNGEWLASREYQASATIKPGELFPFKASNLETTFVDRVDHLQVDLGNGVELMLRK